MHYALLYAEPTGKPSPSIYLFVCVCVCVCETNFSNLHVQIII